MHLKCILLLLLFIGYVQPSFAQQNTSGKASTKNLEQMLSSLKKDQKATSFWWNSWLGLYATGTLVQSGIALQTNNKELKQDMYLGAATTLLGTGAQVFSPRVKIAKNFFEGIENLTDQEQATKMNETYDLLEKSAAFAKEGRSWKMHTVSGVVNLGSGLITWLAFDRTLKDGLINFVINTAITEAQIWSQPILAKKAINKYSERMISGEYIPENKQQLMFSASATASGFQLKLVFY